MKRIILYLFLISVHFHGFGQKVVHISVEADNPLHNIQPGMWGLFFEDINFAADGGLYAELIKNRSFEFRHPMEGWIVEGAGFFNSPVIIVNRSDASPNNPRMARIMVDGSVCIVNHGFRGMGSEPEHIAPQAEQFQVSRKKSTLELDPYSLTILKIQLN